MIKFFRSIRQKLLSEGKTGKYLKYAIGEVILVMIGILLALQVNDWNEERKNRILEKYYLQRIVKDLETDIDEMNGTVIRGFGQVSAAIDILNRMGVDTKEYINILNKGPQNFALAALEQYPLDTGSFKNRGQSFGTYQYLLWAGQEVDLTISTFNELLNNGKLDVITSLEIREQITRHYNKSLAMIDIQDHVTEARSNHKSFLLSQNIPARHNMSFEDFMGELNDQKGYEIALKNYIWGVSFGLNPYRDGALFGTQEMIKQIEECLEQL